MRLNHNMYSLGIFKTYSRNVDNYSKAMNNVSTGYKINSAKDNPNKIAQAETLRMTVIGRNAASSNIQDTSSMLQTFDGAIQEMNNNVSRLKQLTVQAATETINDEDRAVIQKEIEEIKSSLNELANNTEFNGVKLSDNLVTDNANTTRFMKTTIGTLSGEIIDIPRFNVSTAALKIDDIDVTSIAGAQAALEKVDDAVVCLTDIRSRYGAIQSRLDDTNDSMSEISDVLTSAQSSLADADIAKEVMEITKNKILIDSGIGLMAQSNKLPQDALNILANVR
ncbi:flagellin [Clostridium neonatale]|uniref:Flagellin n=1 Tax=Clostridium neonatale TaxID=137838 RepID=A0A2A7MKX1_9CLOT|nr:MULTISPECIES: flagellin [Clostridiaceae]MBS5954815.1 flagellin [Paraclostridium bifermentans]PEG26746.1 flagellin [Clostridium neonatale]PEG32200.1 flagellin [Clostridium neonatale]CAH0438380.1 Putative flagellin domain protein [Clostridium neonatale]CAI3230544.1 putative flagellin domain protein [Clostridium neonatale]